MKKERNLLFIPGKPGKPGYWRTEITFNHRHIRRFAGYTKEQAKAYLGELRVAHREGRLDELLNPKKKTMEVFGAYAKTLLESSEWKAKRSHKRDMISLRHLNRAFKNISLADINPASVRRYMTERREKDKKSPATVNRELSLLKSILYAAEYDGIIKSNPIRGRRVKKFEEANSREKAILAMNITDETQEKMIESAIGDFKLILKIALLTGMRQGEILKMRWIDINTTLKTIRVPVEHAKSKRERIVPINAELCADLEILPKNGKYVFSNPKSKSHIVNVRRPFQAVKDKLKLNKGFRFHDLRHLAAYRLVKCTDIISACKILGHSDPKITMRYVHPTAKDMHIAIERAAENLFQGRRKDFNGEISTAEEELTQVQLIN